MARLDDLLAEIAARRRDVTAAARQLARLEATLPPNAPPVLAARRRLATAREGLIQSEALLERFLAEPESAAGLVADVPVALLPVRIETRFANEATGRSLLVRVYPDEIHVDDHEPELTDIEVAAARQYWERVWRAGRDRVDAERAAFIELADRVGVTRALWVVRVTEPDDTNRPDDPLAAGVPLPSPPQLPDAPRTDLPFGRAAHTRVMPDRWLVFGYRDGRRVARAAGSPVRDPLPVGPSPEGRGGAPPPVDPTAGPPLEDALRWLVDFEAAVQVGMGIRMPLDDASGFDRLLVLGIRSDLDPEATVGRLRELLDGQRYTTGLGIVPPGTPTNNTRAERSGWSRRPSAAEAFEAHRERAGAGALPATANAPAIAAALGVPVEMFAGVVGASGGNTGDAPDLHRALWPATIGYWLETLIAPAVDDVTVEAVRGLFVDWVRGLGLLPALRVGSQPYGLLPVTSIAAWAPAPNDAPRHVRLVGLLRRLAPEWLATTRPGAPRPVPHAGRPGSDPDQELLDILSRDALSGSYRLRSLRGVTTARALAPMVQDLDAAGATLADAAHDLVGGGPVRARLAGFEFDPRTARIRRAPVLPGTLSETEPIPPEESSGLNYLGFLAARRDLTASFSGPGSTSLLFSLARHACALADADAAVRATGPESVVAAKLSLEPEVVDLVPARASATVPRLLARPARDVVSPQLPAGRTLGEFVTTTTPEQAAGLGLNRNVIAALRRTTEVRRALGRLAGRPSASLDRLTRATLDVCSHRLDAWITAYATRRLADVRAGHPTGVHLGGYAWVENLRPKPAPQPVPNPPAGESGPLVVDPANAGFVAAPSLTQASTAALLLSGHLSHRGDGGGPTADQAFAVDLSSERVRLARWLLEGVRQGQPLGALLGYRFERGLHDASHPGLELDRFIRPFRALAPLVAGRRDDVPTTVEAVEAVAASNVVDGLSLLTRFQADPAAVNPALAGASTTERQAVLAQLRALADAADALADLMAAETVYQLAAGNVARAAASLDALGSGLLPPPEPEVVRTPRPGFAYSHRLLVLVPSGADVPTGWESGANRPRRVAEPRLDAWVAGVLGPAAHIRAAVRDAAAPGGVREVTVADVGLCALDLVYDEDVELLLGDSVVSRTDPEWPGGTWPPEVLALDDALEQARCVRDVIGSARSLAATDLAEPGRGMPPGTVDADLADRRAAVEPRFRAAVNELRAARGAGADATARLRDALRAVADFGLAGSRRAAQRASDGAELAAAADAALAEAARIGPEPDLGAMFGRSFVILPLIEAPAPSWADAVAAAARPGFLDGDPAAPVAWLQRVAPARPPIERYLQAVARAGRLIAVQLPPAAQWVGLPLGDGAEPPATATSILVDGVAGPADLAAPAVAGLVVDEWTDVIPARTTPAGVAFHFDEPGARAPNAVLLAVPPALGAPWTLDTLADIVSETADLARIRMVGPEETPWLGRYLPALYVADNPLGDTLTVDLRALVATDEP